MSQQVCRQCRALLTEGAWMCPACGTPILSPDTDRTVLRSALPEAPTSPGLISSVPGVGGPTRHGGPVLAPPTGTSLPTSPAYPAGTPSHPQAAIPTNPVLVPRSNASQQWLPKIAVVLALLGVGSVAWMVVGAGGGSSSSETTISEAATSGSEEADAATTVASTAPAVTEAPVTTLPRPPWPAPPIPDPPIYAGFGLAYAISDPLIGGMPSDQPTPYLVFAQDVFNKMAAEIRNVERKTGIEPEDIKE